MQRHGHGDPSSTPLEQHDGPDDEPPADSPEVPQRRTEPDLKRYDEEEVATVPWPPPPPSQPPSVEA